MRKRVGLIVDAFDAQYQSTLVRHLRLCCEYRRLELVVFPGGILGSDQRAAAQRNVIYDLARSGPLDALILLSATISAHVGTAGLNEFCRRFESLALCSIGLELPGMPSIVVDNASGIRKLTKHLIADHGYRKIAFIRGPSANTEAEQRYAAYCDELRANDIEPDPEYAYEGDFLPESGQRALNVLLNERRLELDAVMACNDYMGIGALEALAAQSPHAAKIASVGFDDIVESSFTVPPLTTVQQPLWQVAEVAVRCIVDQLQGNPVDPVRVLDAIPVLRRSCGCTTSTETATGLPLLRKRTEYEAEFMQLRERILAELARASRGAFTGMSNWEGQLFSAFVDQLRGVPGGGFMLAVERLLRGISQSEGEIWRFHDVLSTLRAYALLCLSGDAARTARAEELIHAARTHTGEAAVRAQAQKRLHLEQLGRISNELATRLANALDRETLTRVLSEELPRLGIRRSFVVLYASDGGSARELATVFHAQGVTEPVHGSFAARELVPDELWLKGESSNWVVLPLFYHEKNFGFAVIQLELDNGYFYESLRTHLSVSLWATAARQPTV
jgi:DNA-binding LacI/PurR family transcriptional regulator